MAMLGSRHKYASEPLPRHGAHCVGGRALHQMTYEGDELRRSWKNCSCPNYASGTLGKRFKRRNTERNRWDESKAVAPAWDGEEPTPAVLVAPTETPRVVVGRSSAVGYQLPDLIKQPFTDSGNG
jgi:hypothetical protein